MQSSAIIAAPLRPPGGLTARGRKHRRAVTRCQWREREGGEAGGFGGGDAEHAQHGLGELVDGRLVDAFGVPLA